MSSLGLLTHPTMSTGRSSGLLVLGGYLLIAVGLVVVRMDSSPPLTEPPSSHGADTT